MELRCNNQPQLSFDCTKRKILCQHIKGVTGDWELHFGENNILECRRKQQKGLTLASYTELLLLLELWRWWWAAVITPAYESVSISLSHTLRPNTPTSPLTSPGLGLDSEWVTLLFTIFQIPSWVFGLAGCPTFSLVITGLLGFSNGAFEEITLFSLSSRGEKMETFGEQLMQSITRTKLELCLTHLATKISSKTCVRGDRDAHCTLFHCLAEGHF